MSKIISQIEFNGCVRNLSCLDEDTICGLPEFASSIDVLPSNQILDIDLEHYGVRVNDQGSSNACVGECVSKALEYVHVQFESEIISLNPYFIYGLINNGKDKGAKLSAGVETVKMYGVCEKDYLPEAVVYPPYASSVYENAIRYKADDVLVLNSFSEILTAITKGFVVVLGIYVGQNFADADSDGVCPLPNSGGGGHAMLGMGLKKHKRWGRLIKVHNSWGRKFVKNGFGYIHEGFFDRAVNAYAIRGMIKNSYNLKNDIPVAK